MSQKPILAIVLAALMLSALAARGQVVGANLSGAVTDPAGAAVPGAAVIVRNLDTGRVHEVTTNASGIYLAPNLPSGFYSVSVAAGHFAGQMRERLELTVGASETLDFKLQLEPLSENLEVRDADPGGPGTGAVVAGHQARELPLNGRDWTQLTILQAGVTQIRTQPDANGVSNRGPRASECSSPSPAGVPSRTTIVSTASASTTMQAPRRPVPWD